MLNEAWTFGVIGNVAWYAALALTVATAAVLAALLFEVVMALRQRSAIAARQPAFQAAAA